MCASITAWRMSGRLELCSTGVRPGVPGVGRWRVSMFACEESTRAATPSRSTRNPTRRRGTRGCGPTCPPVAYRDPAALRDALAPPNALRIRTFSRWFASRASIRPALRRICASPRSTGLSRSGTSGSAPRCDGPPRPPRRSTCSPRMPSRSSAIDGSNGSATRSTRRRAARPSASVSATRARSCTTWWSRLATVTPPGTRSRTRSGRRCATGSAPWLATENFDQAGRQRRRLGDLIAEARGVPRPPA